MILAAILAIAYGIMVVVFMVVAEYEEREDGWDE